MLLSTGKSAYVAQPVRVSQSVSLPDRLRPAQIRIQKLYNLIKIQHTHGTLMDGSKLNAHARKRTSN